MASSSATKSSPISDPAPYPLPQYGYGKNVNFKTLFRDNRFLYRVYTPKERSPFADESDPFLVAPKFDELYARTPLEVTSSTILDPTEAPYSDVARHMDWTTKSSSVYVSTSFSFAWSLWEALRRYHQGMKKDVEIAVIDAQAVADRAATAVEMLQKSSPEERTEQYSKWLNFSRESQSVLIYGFIPGSAVMSSIPLLPLLERLPSYFRRTKAQSVSGNPLAQIAWSYTDKKQTYRQFCQEMSTRFFDTSQELRFRDATGGSLRLALTFLRPWFYRMVVEDFDLAVTTLRDLAIVIAHWGGQWWARDHAELNRILDSMTFTLGEELAQRIKRQSMESSKLHDTVDTLEKIIRSHETDRLARPSLATHGRFASEPCQCASSPITPMGSPRVRPRRTISMSVPSQRGVEGLAPLSLQALATPPETPRSSWLIPKRASLPSFSLEDPHSLKEPFSPTREISPLEGERTPSLGSFSQFILASGPVTPLAPPPQILPPIKAHDDAKEAAPSSSSLADDNVIEEVLRTPVKQQTKLPYLPTPPFDFDTEAPRTPISQAIALSFGLPSPQATPPATVNSTRVLSTPPAAPVPTVSFLPTPPHEYDSFPRLPIIHRPNSRSRSRSHSLSNLTPIEEIREEVTPSTPVPPFLRRPIPRAFMDVSATLPVEQEEEAELEELSLDGVRARTLSDVATSESAASAALAAVASSATASAIAGAGMTGLRIVIPDMTSPEPRPVESQPSPTGSPGAMDKVDAEVIQEEILQEVVEAAPPSPAATNASTDVDSKSESSTLLEPSMLGSPIKLVARPLPKEKEVSTPTLPPLPPSPISTPSSSPLISGMPFRAGHRREDSDWDSVATLPVTPISPATPTGSFGGKPWSQISIPIFGARKLGRRLSNSSESSVTTLASDDQSEGSSRGSLSEEATRSPRGDESPLSPEALVRTREDIQYLPPSHRISTLSSIHHPTQRIPLSPPPLYGVLPNDKAGQKAEPDADAVEEEVQRRLGRIRKHGQILDAASTVVTGFLVGAFVTLFLMSTQRKTLLYLT